MTYSEICARLQAAEIDSAAWDAKLLLEHFCHVSDADLLSDPQKNYDSPQLEQAVLRRAARTPLQYLLGTWSFYRQTYEVSPDCLIPRSDTECLVEEAIASLPDGAFFADLCTGSGCIAISVLAERPDTHAVGIDLSAPALAVSQRNALRNRVADRLSLRQADLLTLTPEQLSDLPRPCAILSNPPYIRTAVLAELEPEVLCEPRMALDGGEDGLVFYRALCRLAKAWLPSDGCCLFEIGYDQGDALCRLAESSGFSCSIRKDYAGCDRVAILRRRRID